MPSSSTVITINKKVIIGNNGLHEANKKKKNSKLKSIKKNDIKLRVQANETNINDAQSKLSVGFPWSALRSLFSVKG